MNAPAAPMNAPPTRLLLVEDDDDERELLAELLSAQGMSVLSACSYNEAVEILETQAVDTVLTDLRLSHDKTGIDVCAAASRVSPGLPVIVVTGHGSLQVAVDAIRAGAYDFITKPVDAQLLSVAISRAVEHQRVLNALRLLKDTQPGQSPGELLGQCTAMQKVYELIHRVAETPASVMVSGESGTGKELVARAIHSASGRRGRMVAINCGAVPANLLESELFGHEKGAFTGASRARPGLLLDAEGGTLLLDEIGEMPEEMQVKLLRVLQERKVRPVGGSAERPFDVRVIAASHRDLESEIEKGRFREDLYYRLNVVQIHLPPLRFRGNDILILANEFVKLAGQRLGREIDSIAPEAAKLLLAYEWPGNVRQLHNCIERAVTLARFNQLTPEDLPEKIRGFEPQRAPDGLEIDPEHVQPLDVVERIYIQRVLDIAAGNKSMAARLLGMDRRTLYRKLESFEESDEEVSSSNR